MDGGVFRDNGDRVQRAEAYSGLLYRGHLAQRRTQGIKKGGDNGLRRTQGCWTEGIWRRGTLRGQRKGKDNGQRRTQGI